MKRRSRILITSAALAVLFGAVFVMRPPSTSFSQGLPTLPQPNRKPACTIFCGDGSFNTIVLAKPPACWGGPLPAGNAGNHYKELSNEDQNAICKTLKSSGGKGSSCPAFKDLMAACKAKGNDSGQPPPETKCEKPTPWFDRSTGCTDVRSPVIAKTAGGVTLSMCGLQIFRWIPPDKDPLLLDAYVQVLRPWVQSRVGDKVCCSSMLNASRAGTPCDPAADIDCDGKPNQSDVDTTVSATAPLPDINLSTSPTGADVDPFPEGLDPNDPNFRPERTGRNSKGVGECDCKWELIKGDMKCGRRLRNHIYTATWRCPSTKAEVVTTKRFPGSSPCSERRASLFERPSFVDLVSSDLLVFPNSLLEASN